MNNYTPFISQPTSFNIKTYNIICTDDMGHINYHDQYDNTKILPNVIHNFMQQIIKKYIDTKYETKNGTVECQSLSHLLCDNLAITLATSQNLRCS